MAIFCYNKNMKYIDAIKGSFVAFIIFFIVSFMVTGVGSSNEMQIIFTVSSFLFAILAGFFISRFNTRYDEVRQQIVAEDANFLALYKTSVFYGKEFTLKMVELIDSYYIYAYDKFGFGGETDYKYNAKTFLAIYDELNEIKQYRTESSFGLMLSYLVDIEKSRNIRAVLVFEKVTRGQWAVLMSLALIIIFSVFYMQTPLFFSQVAAVLLSTVVILILLILRDLQNLRLGGQPMAIESGQEVFDVIGKLRYYNHKYLEDGSIRVPDNIKIYRKGLHEPGEKPKIEVVTK